MGMGLLTLPAEEEEEEEERRRRGSMWIWVRRCSSRPGRCFRMKLISLICPSSLVSLSVYFEFLIGSNELIFFLHVFYVWVFGGNSRTGPRSSRIKTSYDQARPSRIRAQGSRPCRITRPTT